MLGLQFKSLMPVARPVLKILLCVVGVVFDDVVSVFIIEKVLSSGFCR